MEAAMPDPAIPLVERRIKPRYEIHLLARHQTFHKRDQQGGHGHTINLSSHGILVAAPNTLHVGEHVRVSVDWPERLDGQVALQLIVEGRVVRSDQFTFAVAFQHYEFRTEKRPSVSANVLTPKRSAAS